MRSPTLNTMLAKEIMMGMPTQPLMKPKDASVTADGCCFTAPELCAPPPLPPGCRIAVPASASADHHPCSSTRVCGLPASYMCFATNQQRSTPIAQQSKCTLPP